MNSFRGGYSRVLQFCLSLACLSHICTRTEAICYKHGKLLNCLNSIPRRSELEGAGMQISVQINNYGGELIADLPEEKNSYSVNSLQIFNSTIRKIMPRFFSEFSSNGLELLLFNGVSGEFELNAQTLSGLEEVLTTIRVTNSRPLRDISYFAELKKLTKLHLGLTDLAEVPANFATVLSRLISMDLTRNKLTRLPWDALASRIQAVEFQRSRLSDNQWHCDCTLLPLLQVPEDSLHKIVGFQCASPSGVAGFTLAEFRAANLCKSPPIKESGKDDNFYGKVPFEGADESQLGVEPGDKLNPLSGSGEPGSVDLREGTQGENTQDVNTEVASAGLSTEVIAVIVAIVVVALIVLIAVIAFKARQSSQRRTQASRKQPTQKSNSYCAVIEHPSPPRGGSGAQKSDTSGVNNTYIKDPDHVERQPLAPGYRDNRL
ncbi:hypothetical protein D915_004034 [Fasciola hepatica]|uniref:LRRCT domain-containing protein n=1 Tax=Fasciola hepatica TaxID=6192 RepID=A0A4E0S1X3_FASHE|nr:hypothetical protein D915_004034 [Fasciola hepatica]